MDSVIRTRRQVDGVDLVQSRYLPGMRLPVHCDGIDRISIVLAGHVHECVGADEEQATALSVVTKPADVRHHDTFGPQGAQLLSLEVPPHLRVARSRRQGRLQRWRWVHRAVMRQAAGVVAAVRSACEAQGPDGHLDECLSLLLDALDDVPAPASRQPPSWLAGVRERLHEDVDAPTPVPDLAAQVGVHPVRLTRWFHGVHGCTVSTYRQRLRVKKAVEALAAGGGTLAGIAVEAGFCDQAHLTRAVRRFIGTTPSLIRRDLRWPGSTDGRQNRSRHMAWSD